MKGLSANDADRTQMEDGFSQRCAYAQQRYAAAQQCCAHAQQRCAHAQQTLRSCAADVALVRNNVALMRSRRCADAQQRCAAAQQRCAASVRVCAHVVSALQTRVSLRWHVTRRFREGERISLGSGSRRAAVSPDRLDHRRRKRASSSSRRLRLMRNSFPSFSTTTISPLNMALISRTRSRLTITER